jgi:hypothetical protein
MDELSGLRRGPSFQLLPAQLRQTLPAVRWPSTIRMSGLAGLWRQPPRKAVILLYRGSVLGLPQTARMLPMCSLKGGARRPIDV